MTLEPLEHNNMSESVYEILRKSIISQELKSGERINLTNLEERLKVSRTPMRVALKRLELEGLVYILPHRGTFVTECNVERVDENFIIRTAYELVVALQLFDYLKPEDRAYFSQLHDNMLRLVNDSAGDWQGILNDYLKLNQNFHTRLVEIAGPPRMRDLYQQTNVHLSLNYIVPYYQTEDLDAMHAEHEKIFAALLGDSTEQLHTSIYSHLKSARTRIRRYTDLHYSNDNDED